MATPKTIGFHTLGCKLNYSETSSLAKQFEGRGYSVVAPDAAPDIFVLNTCSVTDFADRKCRKAIRQALGRNPDTRVVVTGCYAQLKPEEIAEIKGVDLVLGAGEKFRMVDYVEALDAATDKAWVYAGRIDDVNTFTETYSLGDRTRSFLKVQDGCDYNCSFCTIPKARGKSRSNTIDRVLRTADSLGQQGVKEIVLTGINLGDYKYSAGEKTFRFIDLIRELDTVDNIRRFRISSIEPNLCSNEIIDFVASSERFMPHFHIPLQSGNNKQLKAMRRRYLRELYSDRIERIKATMAHACIGADVITGFPGETENDFQVTYDFLDALDVNYLHVFTYSERDGTPAASMDEVVPAGVRKARSARLRELSFLKRKQFYHQFIGKQRTVLTEAAKVEGVLHGFTDNYIKVAIISADARSNDLLRVEIGPYDEQMQAAHASITHTADSRPGVVL